MKILVVDDYYPEFLRQAYSSSPGLERKPYRQQWQDIMSRCFGVADFFSSALEKLGHHGWEIITNCRPMQLQWAKENSVLLKREWSWRKVKRIPLPWPQEPDWHFPILKAQIESFRPDILYVQCMSSVPAAFLKGIKPYVGKIVGHISSRYGSELDFSVYDLALSSFPHYISRWENEGIPCRYFRLGFGTKVLDLIGEKGAPKWDVSFVGGLSPVHGPRIEWLDELSKLVRIDWWGYGLENAPAGLRKRVNYHGEAWGLDMYRIIRDSRITLNKHVENVADKYANNMRLYEATGLGTCLLTDWKINMEAHLVPGREAETFNSPGECAVKIRHLLAHPDELERIAAAGQQRTLREHTYDHRMRELLDIFAEVF